MKNMRKVLVSSLIMILTCCLFFAGTTFAWFSDSVTSNNNVITAGTLDIELEASYDGSTWFDVNEDTEILSASDLWEPGFTKVVYFKVKNNGSLDLKYSFNVSIVMENSATNVYGEEFKLSDYLKYGSASALEELEVLSGRAAYVAACENQLAPANSLTPNGAVKLEAAEAHYGWLAITMPTSVGNEANTMPGTAAPSLQVGFNLVASQVNSEEDSFGPDYDADANGGEANVPVAAVQKATELAELDETNVLYLDSYSDLLVKGEDAQPLETQYSFYATETPAEALDSYYRYWHADFVISFSEEVPAGAAAIAGQYGNKWTGDSWIVVSNKNDVIPANTELRLLEMLLGATINYEELSNITEGFHCGAYDLNDALAGVTLTVELRLYETLSKEESSNNSVNEETGEYIVIGSYSHTFEHTPTYVANASELAAAVAEGGLVVLTEDIKADVEVSEVPNFLTVANDKLVILDLNGHDIVVNNNSQANKNHSLIRVYGTLEVTGEGSLVYTDKGINMGWNALSAVISAEAGMVVLNEGVSLVHNGGTDMAYAVDVNTTLGDTSLVINGAHLSSTYTGVRIFNNHKTAKGTVVLNSGSVEGLNRDIWLQNANSSSLFENGVVEIADSYTYTTETSETSVKYYID